MLKPKDTTSQTRSQSHHLLRLGELDGLACLNVEVLLTTLKLTRTDAHEGDMVTVSLVHVGLDLKDEGGEVFAEGVHLALIALTGEGGGG